MSKCHYLHYPNIRPVFKHRSPSNRTNSSSHARKQIARRVNEASRARKIILRVMEAKVTEGQAVSSVWVTLFSFSVMKLRARDRCSTTRQTKGRQISRYGDRKRTSSWVAGCKLYGHSWATRLRRVHWFSDVHRDTCVCSLFADYSTDRPRYYEVISRFT